MKWLLIFWALPVSFLGLWYGLSYYDMSFGLFFFSREMHDTVFAVYGKVLGMPPADIPPLATRAIIVDTLLVFGIILLRKRVNLKTWWNNRQEIVLVNRNPGSRPAGSGQWTTIDPARLAE